MTTGKSRRAGSPRETAESMAARQREISVSEFFLKNRHLLGFDSPRRALLTAVKEAVDNALDACEESGILPEIMVELEQTAPSRFRVTVTDNGPGIVRAQIPRIFAKLLYGSKFHRLRMSRGQQGIGISAAGMYGQLTTGGATRILSRISPRKPAHHLEVHIDTRSNKPAILKDVETDWCPVFPAAGGGEYPGSPHGTCVSIEMEAAYVRGRLSVDEFLQQCAIVNPHLRLHYQVHLLPRRPDKASAGETPVASAPLAAEPAVESHLYDRALSDLPPPTREIQPHPLGVELGMLMQMLKDTRARTLKTALTQEFCRVSDRVALEICSRATLDPSANPTRIAHRESEALFKAISETRFMRPPTDGLAPIGEAAIEAGLRKEVDPEFVTAVTRSPEVYRGNPFIIEVGLAIARPGGAAGAADDPVRLLRFANRVPLLHMAGGCAITRAVTGVDWKSYGLAQPKGSLPQGPVVIMVHMASVWVPFTSESKDAIASYGEILKEVTLGLQECGRRMSVFVGRRHRAAEADRKRSYIEMYLPHLALGLKQVLSLSDRDEQRVLADLRRMLEKSHLDA